MLTLLHRKTPGKTYLLIISVKQGGVKHSIKSPQLSCGASSDWDSRLLLVLTRSALKKTSLLRLLPPAVSVNKGDTGSIGDMSSLDWPTESRDVWVSLRSPNSGSTVMLLPLSHGKTGVFRKCYLNIIHFLVSINQEHRKFSNAFKEILRKKAFDGRNLNFRESLKSSFDPVSLPEFPA